MKKFIVMMASVCALIAGFIVAPASAAPTSAQGPTVVEYTDSPFFTGGRYRAKPICIHQMFTSSNWAPGDIGNLMEPAIDTGWRSASQGCGDYSSWQVLRVALYQAEDGRCTKWTGTSNPASIYSGHPMNDWYNRVWDGVEFPTVWINQFYNNTCWLSDFDKDYRLSREMLNVVGLQAHCYEVAGYETVLNSCNVTQEESLPVAIDRNRITTLMNP